MLKDRTKLPFYVCVICCSLFCVGTKVLPHLLIKYSAGTFFDEAKVDIERVHRTKRDVKVGSDDFGLPRLVQNTDESVMITVEVKNSSSSGLNDPSTWSKRIGVGDGIPPGKGPAVNSTILPNYRALINQPYLCHKVDYEDDVQIENYPPPREYDILLTILVHSHPTNKRRRDAIRETWGRIAKEFNLGSKHVVVVFILGLPVDVDEYQRVEKEARLYRDVVVYDFLDEYRNLTIKSLLGMYWTSVHCSKAKYIMKADDDVYINVPFIISELKSYQPVGLLLGSVNSRSPVKRYGQWRVEYSVYPYATFPPYCSGCLYIMSADMASKLYSVSEVNKPQRLLPVEDVYVTGILAERVGIKCQHHEHFPTWINVPSLRFLQKFLKGEILGLHGVDWIRMHSIWQMIQKCHNCSHNLNEIDKWFSQFSKANSIYEL